MVSEMIDIPLAERIMSQISIGAMIEIELDGVKHTRKVVEKTLYGLTVQGPTNKLYLSVENTTLYRKANVMSRIPASEATGARRGRPRKVQPTGPQAPPETPENRHLPPGYTGPDPFKPKGQAAQPPAGNGATPSWASAVHRPGESLTDTADVAQGITHGEPDIGWAMNAFDATLERFREDISTLMQTVANAAPEPETAEPLREKPPTCADCEHSNLPANKCEHWNVTPPMQVICNASECPAFSALPF